MAEISRRTAIKLALSLAAAKAAKLPLPPLIQEVSGNDYARLGRDMAVALLGEDGSLASDWETVNFRHSDGAFVSDHSVEFKISKTTVITDVLIASGTGWWNIPLAVCKTINPEDTARICDIFVPKEVLNEEIDEAVAAWRSERGHV